MKKNIITIVIASFICGLLTPGYPSEVKQAVSMPDTLALSDCYSFALKQSELIAINVDLIKVTEAHFLQALSIMLPHVSFISTDFQEEVDKSSSGGSLGSLKP